MYRNYNKIKAFVEEQVTQCTVLVVGDVMLDKYYFGEVKRISPEAPVPVTRVMQEKETLGGAGNVAHNLARLGCRTLLAGAVGNDIHCDSLCRLLDERNIIHEGLVAKDGPTTTKLRVIGGHQQMLRLDFEETSPVGDEVETKILYYVDKALQQKAGSVILSDYGKGICTSRVCQAIISKCAEYHIPVIIDPKGSNWHKYTGASFITPNIKELNEVSKNEVTNEDEPVKQAAQTIRRKFRIKNMMVTRSEKGLSLVGAKRCVHIPTLAQEVFDVSGAGDTVIAVMGAALSAGLDPVDSAYLANMAAGVVVGKLGTYAISRQELLEALENTN
ncbi:MAG: D-glycero-beta-D-manno-heptose-7-phosphate kinase [Veillonellales bacterium]